MVDGGVNGVDGGGGGGSTQRALSQPGVRLKVKGLSVEAEAEGDCVVKWNFLKVTEVLEVRSAVQCPCVCVCACVSENVCVNVCVHSLV